MTRLCHLLFGCFALVALSVPLRAEAVTIFAAASLKTALDQALIEQEIDAIAVYGGSAAMARQVAQGAGADIVILAHPEWMAWLAAKGHLQDGSRCDFLGNTLVLAGASDAADLTLTGAQDLLDGLQGGRLAIGQMRSVPAGQYAAAYLDGKGWLDALRPHLAETSNVRLALALIARGEVPLGFVYQSDVISEPKVRRVFSPDPEDYPAIRYPVALTRTATAQAQEVLERLKPASDVFAENGFSLLAPETEGACQ